MIAPEEARAAACRHDGSPRAFPAPPVETGWPRNPRMRNDRGAPARPHRIGNDLRDGRIVIGQPVDERGVGAVLQQPADQIGQQIFVAADRRIDTAGWSISSPATTCS